MANLAFDINSFHYRYYMFIRYMWGYTDKLQRTSLCPYCQTMFWGSIFIVIFSWALVLGWVCMKLGRMACKLQNPWADAMIKYLDKKTEWMTALDSGPTDFVENPMWTAMSFCLMGIKTTVAIAGSVVILGALFGVVGFGLWNIVDVGAAILYGVAWVFSLFFMCFYWVGFVCDWTYPEIVWLFTNGELWYNVLSWVVYIIAWVAYIITWILGVGVTSVILCLLFIGISKLPLSRRFGKFLTNRLNGYNEAQEQRRDRAREAVKELPPWKCEYCDYDSNPVIYIYCRECHRPKPKPMNPFSYLLLIFSPIFWVLQKGFTVKDKIGSREINIIGPLGIFWSYLVAIKKGVCPIIEFVDPAELQSAVQASAKDRMERENEPDD